jgi:hypothetical protein
LLLLLVVVVVVVGSTSRKAVQGEARKGTVMEVGLGLLHQFGLLV